MTDDQVAGARDPNKLDNRDEALSADRIWQSLRTLYDWAPAAVRAQLKRLVVLMTVVSILEAVSIAALFAFIHLLSEPESTTSGNILARTLHSFAQQDTASSITQSAIVVGSLLLLTALSRLLLTWRLQVCINTLGHLLSVEIFDRMLRQPYELFIRRNSSEILGGMDKVQGLVLGVFAPTLHGLSALIMTTMIAAVLLILAPGATLIAALFVAVVYTSIIMLTRKRLARVSDELSVTYVSRIKIIQEGLGGIRDIIIDRTGDVFIDEFRNDDGRFRKAQVQSQVIGIAPRWIVEGLGMVAVVTVAAAVSVQTGGVDAALPILGAFAVAALRIMPQLQQIYAMRTAFASYSGLLSDVIRLTRAPVRVAVKAKPQTAPMRDSIALQNVSFRYYSADKDALKNVSLHVPSGSRIGIMGPSGSGKSTLLDLFMGLLEPTSGQILLDGKPMTGELNHAWQSRIAHVPQSIFLADTSIASNIAFGSHKNCDMNRVARAASDAGLGTFLDSLPDGLNTGVGERGVALSGGQRQRIGLARALYKAPSVLILDEATSALDADTERAVLQSIAAMDRKLTILSVAHKRSSLDLSDTIYMMENGILREDTPDKRSG